MADLTFSQPVRRNLATPILLAVVVLVIAGGLMLLFTPHTTADVAVKKTAVYSAHTVFKSESTIVGRDTAQDDLYVLVTLHIDNRLRLPLFLKDFTATLTPSNPDGTPAEDVTANGIEKLDIPNLYASFPALKSLVGQQGVPLLLRETRIDPGQSAEGIILLHFPASQHAWEQRKSASLSIALYHQQPLIVPIPKS
ncbi:hypothetical protein [Granulicella sp. dw_53]|uniref:hypothetical protein n=1 Tax=Granulicella sp. dw_53 TaxID=2719792 RepID=UPI001BD43DE9|nr:hypothetical protein [Granulicella sp. dw_53]